MFKRMNYKDLLFYLVLIAVLVGIGYMIQHRDTQQLARPVIQECMQVLGDSGASEHEAYRTCLFWHNQSDIAGMCEEAIGLGTYCAFYDITTTVLP